MAEMQSKHNAAGALLRTWLCVIWFEVQPLMRQDDSIPQNVTAEDYRLTRSWEPAL